MTDREIVRFCPSCGLQVPPESISANDCCKKTALLVYADSIEAQRMGPWKFERVKEEDMGEVQTSGAELRKKRGHPQTEIPGTEKIAHKDIRKVAQELYELRIERIEIQKKEEPLHEKLIALMEKHGVEHCEEGDLDITLTTVEKKVKIRRKKGGASDVED